MEFHRTQDLVAASKAKYRVVDCGRQWGKTTLAAWEMLGVAYAKPNARILYFATTKDQARDIAWAMLKDFASPIVIGKPNETRLEITVSNLHGGTSFMKLEGYENIETQRGKQFDFIVPDEVAKMRNFMYSWSAILRPTLAFRKGTAMFISTPRGYNHFHEMYQWGQDKSMVDWESWKFTSYDNPFLPVGEVEAAKRESTPEFFAQEWLADFTRFTGLIYQELKTENHVHWFDHTLDDPGEYIMGLDFAVRGYTAAIIAQVKLDGHIYILDNYKVEGQTAEIHAEAIKDLMKRYTSLDKFVGYGDPTGWIKGQQAVRGNKPMQWSLANEYLEMGLPIVPGNNKVVPGINYVKQLLREGKLHIHPRCTALIDELLQYQWKDQPTTQVGEKSEPEEPRKVNDHLVDALRYMLYSKPQAAPEEKSPFKPGMPIIFGAPKIELPDEQEQLDIKEEDLIG